MWGLRFIGFRECLYFRIQKFLGPLRYVLGLWAWGLVGGFAGLRSLPGFNVWSSGCLSA